jgi:hypothetical protein
MKKQIIGSLLAVSVFFGATAFAGNTVANVDDATNATFAGIAAVSAKKHRIKEIKVVSGVTEKLQLKCGSTVKQSYLLEANKLNTFSYADDELQCGTNEAFNFTKTTANTSITGAIKYIDQN